jgi:hypothetical protein
LSSLKQNPRQRGSNRDNQIMLTLEEHKALTTEQITALLFRFAYGQRKAQERLLKLYQRGNVSRSKLNGSYAYYFERPGQLEHLIGVNWIRIWLQVTCASWEKVESFSYEMKYRELRTDGFAAIKNTVTGKHRFCFIEYDRTVNNTFDKVPKYGKLYTSGNYATSWWVELTNRFPAILVVSEKRAEQIRKIVKEQNSAGLEFKAYSLDEIRKEAVEKCMNTIGRTD